MPCVGKGKEEILKDLEKLTEGGEDPILEIDTEG